MKLGMIAGCVLFLILGDVGLAQTPYQMPQPGPEQKRLQYYAGTWTSEYEMKTGPAGSGGKMIATDHTQMMPGSFFAVTHTDGKGTMGELHGLAIMGYDAESKSYTYDSSVRQSTSKGRYREIPGPGLTRGTLQSCASSRKKSLQRCTP